MRSKPVTRKAKRCGRRLKAKSIDGATYVLIRQAGETGQLYGSVAARDISEAANAKLVTRSSAGMSPSITPIKTIGVHEVNRPPAPGSLVQDLTINVARSPDEAERQAKGENVIAAGQAADKAADDEAAREIASAAAAANAERGPSE